MLMPFGKHKGHELTALPDEYLLWLAANIPLRAPLGISQQRNEKFHRIRDFCK